MSRAIISSGEPGSVTMTKRSPDVAHAGVGERLPVRPAVRIGLHSGAGLAGHDHDRAVEPVGQRGAHLVRVGGVEHGQRNVRGYGR